MTEGEVAMLCPTGSHRLCPGLHPRDGVVPNPDRWCCPCACHHQEPTP